MARNYSLSEQEEAAARGDGSPRYGSPLGALDRTADRAAAGIHNAGVDEFNGVAKINAARTAQSNAGAWEPAELAFNDETGDWAVMANDGTVRVVDKDPATLFALSDMEGLKPIDGNAMPTGFRPISQAKLREILASIPEDSDFWGEAGASFKSTIGLAASSLDSLIGNDDPSNAWSRAGEDYTKGQTIGQYKASRAAWYESLPGFVSGLGQTTGNVGGTAVGALPGVIAGAAGGTAAGGPVGGAVGGLGVAGMAVTGGMSAYGEQANEFYRAAVETMGEMSDEEIAADSPLYAQILRENGGDREDAIREVAIQGARAAGAPAAALGAIETYIGGRIGGRILSKLRGAGSAVPKRPGALPRLGRIAGRGALGGAAAGAEEVAETSLGQAAGAGYTGLGSDNPLDYASFDEFEAASQGGFIFGALGGRRNAGAAHAESSARADLEAALSSSAGTQARTAPPAGQDTPAYMRGFGGRAVGEGTQSALPLQPPAGFDLNTVPNNAPQGPLENPEPQLPEQDPAQMDLLSAPQPSPQQVEAERAAALQQDALDVLVEITGLQPDQFQQAMPDLLDMADENPSFRAVMEAAGVMPGLIEQSPESRAEQASAALEQWNRQPLQQDGMQIQAPTNAPAQQGEPGSIDWASRVRGDQSAQRAAVSMHVPVEAPEPLAAPKERTPDGRPVGVAPAPLPNPEPMAPEQAAQAAQTRAQRRRSAGAPPSPVEPVAAAAPAAVEAAAASSREQVSPSTPEPAADVAAQVDALLAPDSARDAVFVAAGNEEAIPANLPKNVRVIERAGVGVLLTTNANKATKFRTKKNLTDADVQRILGYSENKADVVAAGEEPVVVEARTPEGAVAAQQIATPRNKHAARAAVARQARTTANVVETTPHAAQSRRAAEAPRNPVAAKAAERREQRESASKPKKRPAKSDDEKRRELEAKGLEVATDEELQETPRAADKQDVVKTERAARTARVTGESKPAERLDVSAQAKNPTADVGEVKGKQARVEIPESLIAETGSKGVVDLRVQAVDEKLRQGLRAILLDEIPAEDAKRVERVLTRMEQLDTMLDAAVDAAEERLLNHLDESVEGRDLLEAAKATRLRAEIKRRRAARTAEGKDNRGRPLGRPKSSPLEFVPLTMEEMLHFGRLVRRQAKAEVNIGQLDPAKSLSRRLLPQLFPALDRNLDNAQVLHRVVEMVSHFDDEYLDNLVRSGAMRIRHQLLAKQVMRGPTEVARVHVVQQQELVNELKRKSPGKKETPESQQAGPVTEITMEAMDYVPVNGPHATSYKGNVPENAHKLLNDWLAMMERGGIKMTGDVTLLSMDAARVLYGVGRVPFGRAGQFMRLGKDDKGKPQFVIAVDWENIENEGIALETLAHEFGHYVSEEVFNRSDKQTQLAVWNAYKRFLMTRGSLSPSEVFRSHAPGLMQTLLPTGHPLDLEYAESFSEWSANHVARYMLTKPEPAGLVEKYFARIAEVMRKVYAKLFGTEQPNAAWAAAIDNWISGAAAANANPFYSMDREPASMEAFGTGGDSQAPAGRKTAQAVLRHATAVLSEAQGHVRDVYDMAAGRDIKGLDAAATSLAKRVMESDMGKYLRRFGLSLTTLDQIERMFRDKGKFGEALSTWVRAQKRKAQLARVAMFGGEFDGVKFVGASDVLERANHLSEPVRVLLQDVMYYATRYGIHPDKELTHADNKHLLAGSEAARKANERRYQHLQNLWEKLGTSDPGALLVYEDLRKGFLDLHEKTLQKQIDNLVALKSSKQAQPLSQEAIDEAIELVKANTRTLREGPYFPLMRFGDWIVKVSRPSTSSIHATRAEAEAAQKEQRALHRGVKVEIREEAGEFVVTTFHKGVYFFDSEAEAKAARPQIEADLREEYEAAGVDIDEVRAVLNDQRTDDSEHDLLIEPPFEGRDFVKSLDNTEYTKFVSEVRKAADDRKLDPELARVMENLFIESLPELSARKSLLPRQNILGASKDMLKAYAMRYQGAAHAYSAVSFGQQVQKAWADMEANRNNVSAGGAVFNNLHASQEAVAKATNGSAGSRVQSFITDASSLFSLAFNPAYILTNAMQPWMITMPVLAGASWQDSSNVTRTIGPAKAMTYIKAAYEGALPYFSKRGIADFIDESKRLFGQQSLDPNKRVEQIVESFGKTADEKRMLTHLLESGRLDFSFLNSIEDAMKGAGVERKLGNVAALGMALPQQVEAMNRVVTALASYRIAREEMAIDHASAIDYASDVVGDTQLDYSRLNRPLAFNKSGWRVVLQFKLYMQGMYALFVRNAYLMLKGASPAERKQGAQTLMYLLGTHGAIGGATGLGPIAAIAKFGLWVAVGMGLVSDEDDEWKSTEELYREYTTAAFGEKGSLAVERGLPALLGLDVADRLGLPILADTRYTNIRESDDAGTQMDKWLLYFMGAPYANLRRVVKAGGAAIDEDPYTRVADGLPAGPRAMWKALQTARDGIVDHDGDTFIGADQLDWKSLAITGMGFSPTDVAAAYRQRSEEKGTIARIQADRTLLLKRWRTAEPGDLEAIREEIREFNDKAPKPFRITGEALARSASAKKDRDAGKHNRQEAAIKEYLQ